MTTGATTSGSSSFAHDDIQPIASSHSQESEPCVTASSTSSQESPAQASVATSRQTAAEEDSSSHALLSHDPVRREAKWQSLLLEQRKIEEESLGRGAERFKKRIAEAEKSGKGSTIGAAKRLLTHGIAPTEAAISYFLQEQKTKRGARHTAAKWIDLFSAHTVVRSTGEKERWLVVNSEGDTVARCKTEKDAIARKEAEEAKREGVSVVAYLTVRVVLDSLGGREMVSFVAAQIAELLMDELRYRRFRTQAPGLFTYMLRSFQTSNYTHMARSMNAAMRNADIDVSDLKMTVQQRIIVGTKLIDLMIQATSLAAVEHDERKTDDRKRSRRTPLILTATPETREFLNKRNGMLEFLTPVLMPMVVPPIQWEPGQRGGYRFALRNKVALVRSHPYRDSQCDRLNRDQEMPLVYQTVNAIQNTPWQINGRVLDLVTHIYDRQLPYAGVLPSAIEEEPRKPEDIATNPEERKKWRKAAHGVIVRNRTRQSRLSDVSRMLEMAERMRGYDAIFFPHNVDFRGRIYPVSHRLHPQGDDLQKGLLRFAQGKPLGESGASYLALFGASCLGKTPTLNGAGGEKVSRMTLDERIQWIEDHSAEICAAANDPMGYRWWTEAEEPVQFYAFCVEWDGFCKMQREGRGYEYVCQLPVSVDGSCNGLQHFSAMLRDETGAKAVNVYPNERPEDVYDRIASSAKDRLEEMASGIRQAYLEDDGNLYWCHKCAKHLPRSQFTKGDHRGVQSQCRSCKAVVPEDIRLAADSRLAAAWLASGLVDRKLTKRPTMTFSYGSKPYGFQQQLIEHLVGLENWHQLAPLFIDADGKDTIQPMCSLMAQMIWLSLQDVVVAAFRGMEWMQRCARVIANSGKPIEWTVPRTGFRVRQEYFVTKQKQIETVLAGKVYQPVVNEATDEIQLHKQANAVSPNVIHSLDAAGLMLAVSQAAAEGVEQFAAVHDSYGALPADMPVLWRAARQSFVHLYGDGAESVIEDLARQFAAQAPEELPPAPARGSLDVNAVLASDYFFC